MYNLVCNVHENVNGIADPESKVVTFQKKVKGFEIMSVLKKVFSTNVNLN